MSKENMRNNIEERIKVLKEEVITEKNKLEQLQAGINQANQQAQMIVQANLSRLGAINEFEALIAPQKEEE